MHWIRRILLSTVIGSMPLLARGADEHFSQPVTIPLGKVWALEMPGTRDVRELKKDKDEIGDNSLADRIIRSPSFRSSRRQTDGFAVVGDGLDALREAYRVLAKDKAPPESIPVSSEVTLVFFSQAFNCYVHLQSIERRHKQVIITYSFVPHLTKELTEHFALIPLGRLSAGVWRVDVVQAPMSNEDREAGFSPISAKVASQIVSQAFEFKVVNVDQ